MSQFANDGTFKVECPVCGFITYSDKMVMRWDGVYVHQHCWDPRHPGDFRKIPRTEQNYLREGAKPEKTHKETDTTNWVGVGETDPGGR